MTTEQKHTQNVSRDILDDVTKGLNDWHNSRNCFPGERVISTAQGTNVQYKGRNVINFCANNYIGLTNHPRLQKAAKDTIDTHGFGMSSVRPICGTQNIHKQLEAAITAFHKTDDTVLYPSCYDANVGIFQAILTHEDVIISDALNHASIIDGVRLCKAKRAIFKHNDMKDLERVLKQHMHMRVRMIAVDGVFSMDGDIAPLDEIVALAKKYKAQTFVDECHATGVLGENGRGTAEYFGVEGQIDIINSTLGKALGGASGGYTSARQGVCDVLRWRARPYVYSNAVAPAIVGASIEVFKMLGEKNDDRVKKLQANTKLFRAGMAKAGFKVMGSDQCAICPVYFGKEDWSKEIANSLLEEHNILTCSIPYPIVPKGQARIRCGVSAAHTPEQINEVIRAFTALGLKYGAITKNGESLVEYAPVVDISTGHGGYMKPTMMALAAGAMLAGAFKFYKTSKQ